MGGGGVGSDASLHAALVLLARMVWIRCCDGIIRSPPSGLWIPFSWICPVAVQFLIANRL